MMKQDIAGWGRRLGLLSPAAALLVAAAAATAQTTAPREVVVTATRIPTDIEEVGSSVTVITGEELERNQQRTLVEALGSVPGLRAVQLGGPGNQASIFSRGANSNHMLVLIDGLEATDPSAANGAFDFGHLQLENIDRVEVVRGPQSTLYGSDAIGGVVNIITKKGSGAPAATARIEGGSRGTANPAAGFQGTFGKTSVATSLGYFRTEGESVTAPRVRPAGALAEADAYENFSASTRVGTALGERGEASLIARYVRTDADTDPTAEDPNEQIQQNQYFLRLETKGRFFSGRWEPILAFDYTRYERDTANDPDSLADTFGRTRNVGIKAKASLQNDLHLADWNTATFGVEVKSDTMRQATTSLFPSFGSQLIGSTDADVDNRAVFAQDKITLFDQLTATIGVRHDDHQSFGGKTTWRVTPVWRVPDTGLRLKGSYGTGFRAPALFELFGQSLLVTGFGNFPFNGNPDLKPEESRGWEAGFDQSAGGGKMKFGATYFRNDIENLVVCGFTTCSNTSDAETWGVESFVKAEIMPRVSTTVAYTYTRAEDATLSSDLRRRPKHKADIGVTVRPVDPARVTLAMVTYSRQKDVDYNLGTDTFTPGVTLFNLYGSYDLDERYGVFARAENLLDRNYEIADGFAGPGLRVLVGLRGRF